LAFFAKIHRGTPASLALLARHLRDGGLVAVPAETVYGLAGDATSAAACLKIFAAKGRPLSDPLIVHIAALRDLERVAYPNEAALKLARAFWPGPLTIILPKKDAIPGAATANLPSVAVRMPSNRLFRRLIRLAGVPLAAPSANPFGYVSPTTAAHVMDHLGSKISHILDGGASVIGVESTIVDLRNPMRPVLMRPGAVTRAQLRKVLGMPVPSKAKGRPASRAQVAPGQMKRHYSPRTPVILHAKITRAMIAKAGPEDAWLLLSKPGGPRLPNVSWLDAKGDIKRSSRRLFAALRELDETGFRRIHVERPKGPGLAEAIADRLIRASSR
jgi:L-threonylcarbamoyladenylate synthase